VQGGYLNKVKGRFGTVVGGTHNEANGRHSLAMGYYSTAVGDNSAVFGFNGDDCTISEDNSIRVCADHFIVNGDDLVAELASSRQLFDGSEERSAQRIQDLQQIVKMQSVELENLSGVHEEQLELLQELQSLENEFAQLTQS